MTSHIISPHGGTLVNLLVSNKEVGELKTNSKEWVSWNLQPRQVCDLELLLNGGFSPLTGFMGKKDYESVCSSMRLANGTIWPIPIILDVSGEFADKLSTGQKLVLRDPEGVMLAVMDIEDIWKPDRQEEATLVYGSDNKEHPGVAYLLNKTNPYYVGGSIKGIQTPEHFDFRALRLTPAELRADFIKFGWRDVVAFQTRNPMHRAHFDKTGRH